MLAIPEHKTINFLDCSAFEKALTTVLDNVNGLVHDCKTEEGRKSLKSDVASIGKYTTNAVKHINDDFKACTKDLADSKTRLIEVTKAITASKDIIKTQLDEHIAETIKQTGIAIKKRIDELRSIWAIEEKFKTIADVSSLLRLSGTLTSTGALTKKAEDFLKAIVESELFMQERDKSRRMELDNRCLRADINPPLTPEMLGDDFEADTETFSARLKVMIEAELTRKVELEERIARKKEADHKKQIAEQQATFDAALKAQQDEADAVARGKAQKERLAYEKLEKQKEDARQEIETAKTTEVAGVVDDVVEPEQQTDMLTRRTVNIALTFSFVVGNRITDDQVLDGVLNQLPELLKTKITNKEVFR